MPSAALPQITSTLAPATSAIAAAGQQASTGTAAVSGKSFLDFMADLTQAFETSATKAPAADTPAATANAATDIDGTDAGATSRKKKPAQAATDLAGALATMLQGQAVIAQSPPAAVATTIGTTTAATAASTPSAAAPPPSGTVTEASSSDKVLAPATAELALADVVTDPTNAASKAIASPDQPLQSVLTLAAGLPVLGPALAAATGTAEETTTVPSSAATTAIAQPVRTAASFTHTTPPLAGTGLSTEPAVDTLSTAVGRTGRQPNPAAGSAIPFARTASPEAQPDANVLGRTTAKSSRSATTVAATTLIAVTASGLTGTDTQAARDADPTLATSEIAEASLRQAITAAPMSRMAEIRLRLQAVQTGATRTATSSATAASKTEPAATVTKPAVTADLPALAVKPAATPAATEDRPQALPAPAADASASATVPTGPADQTAAPDLLPDVQASAGDPGLTAATTSTLKPTADGATTSNPAAAAVPLAAVGATLVAHARSGDSSFTIRLDPADLGQIDVKMKVSADGQVRAHLIVERTDTLDLLLRDQRGLQQQLDQAGFKTDASALQFSLRDQGQQGQQSWQGSSQQQERPAAKPDQSSPPPEQAAYTRASYVRADAVDVSV